MLSSASIDLDRSIALPSTSENGRKALGDLKLVVDRNLATALRDSGQCAAAKALLTSLQNTTSMYRGDLIAKCYDRDTGVFQSLADY